MCTGRWPVHSFQKRQRFAAALIGAAALVASVPAAAESASAASVASVPAIGQTQAGQSVADFYKARQDAPLWLAPQAGDAALKLLTLLNTSSIDGLTPAKYDVPELQKLLDRARAKNKRKDVERADEALSQAFVAYVDDLRQDPGVGITWVDPSLKPTAPTPLGALLQAAAAPSLSDYVAKSRLDASILRRASGRHRAAQI